MYKHKIKKIKKTHSVLMSMLIKIEIMKLRPFQKKVIFWVFQVRIKR